MAERADGFSDFLDGIERRCRRATPGPWRIVADDSLACVWLNGASEEDERPIALFDYRNAETNQADAQFVANARGDVPRLIEELRILRGRVQDLLEANNREVQERLQMQRERNEALHKVNTMAQQLAQHATAASRLKR
ncbi:hypothetical protein WCLP8_4280011 [uncultured Gammaproteobacteria bacterium]